MADSGTYTPEVLARRAEMAKMLLAQPKQPIRHWAEGLNQLAEGYFGGKMLSDVDKQQMAGEKAQNDARMNMLGLGGATPTASDTVAKPTPGATSEAVPVPSRTSAGMPGLDTAIETAAAKYGIDPAYLRNTAKIESNNGRNLSTPLSSAGGPFAFIDDTAKQYGLVNKNDPEQSADAAARLALDNKKALAKALGRDPTNGELYLAHQQGAGGAGKLLANPDAPAISLVGQRAIANNGGSPAMTAGQFAQGFTRKFGDDGAALPPNARPAQAIAPQPDQGGAVPQVAQALNAPAAPSASPDHHAGTKAQIAKMLSDPSPYVRKQGAALADAFIQKNMIKDGPKYHKLNDEMLFDENTGQTRAAGPGFKPLVDPAERAAHGIPADDKRPYQVGPGNKLINPPAETRVSIDQRAETAYDTAAAKHQAERHDKLVQGGMEAKALRGDVNALRDIGSRITTGKTAELTAALGPYAEALGVKIDGLGDLQAYNAIVSKMAPRMRVAGSGATSDFEMRKYLEAIPTLGKTPEGNAMIEATMEAYQDHQEKAAEIGSMALNKEITARQADKMLRELPDPLTSWKQNKGKLKLDAAPPVAGAGAPELSAIEAEMKRRGLK